MNMDDDKKEPEATWKYKTSFAINDKISEVVQETIKVTEAQIEQYRRKISKLIYGS